MGHKMEMPSRNGVRDDKGGGHDNVLLGGSEETATRNVYFPR